MKNSKTLKMVQLTILIAIVLLMSFTPIGYLRTAGLEISLLTIPIVIGAMLLGPKAGAVLGAVFGLTSFWQCFGMSPFGMVLLGINPVGTFLVCVPTRILMGWLTGVLFQMIEGVDKTHTLSYFAGGLIGAALNTLFFMGTLMLFFWRTEYIQELNASLGRLNVVLFVCVFVGINGLLELPASCLAGGAVAKAVERATRTMA